MKVKTLVKMTLGISISLMLLALTQEAYCTARGCVYSLHVLAFGFFGIFIGADEAFGWFANPLLFLAWAFIKNRKVTLMLSLLSTLLALSFLMFDEVVVTEAGHKSAVIKYALGYWLWIGSHSIMLFGNVLIVFKIRADIENSS